MLSREQEVPAETEQKKESDLDFIGRQVFVVDPRRQGFGLREYKFLDAYANKFFILSGKNGVFASPKVIPAELLSYYDQLGIDTCAPQNIINLESETDNTSLAERVKADGRFNSLVGQREGSFLIPYMVTEEVEELARQRGLYTLADSSTVSRIADKAEFQEELASLSHDIKKDTGYDVAIPMLRVRTSKSDELESAYSVLSRNGKNDILLIKPKSASGLGIFVLRAEKGIKGLVEILRLHFNCDEEVLMEEFIPHNHSPSMQGIRTPDSSYSHLYFGRQIISSQGESISYDSSQLPFASPVVKIDDQSIGKLREIHEALGQNFISNNGVAGVAGFDAVTSLSSDGKLEAVKITELNLHLPSSFAVYAAMMKVFPNGFEGVAHNVNIPLPPGLTVTEFMRQHTQLLISHTHQYGLFPLNLSYEDKVDLIVFARNEEHLNKVLGEI